MRITRISMALGVFLAGCHADPSGQVAAPTGNRTVDQSILRHPWWKPGVGAAEVEAIVNEVCAHGEGYVFYDQTGKFVYLPVSAFFSGLRPPTTVLEASRTFTAVPGVDQLAADNAKSLSSLARPRRILVIAVQHDGGTATEALRDSLDQFDSMSWRGMVPKKEDLFDRGKPKPQGRPVAGNKRQPPSR